MRRLPVLLALPLAACVVVVEPDPEGGGGAGAAPPPEGLPTILLVQDRSGSMNGCWGGAAAGEGDEGCGRDADGDGVLDTRQRSRMDEARRVVGEVVAGSADLAVWGLVAYGFGSSSCGDPALLVAPDPAAPLDGAAALVEAFDGPDLRRPNGGTPTTSGLALARELLVGRDGLRVPAGAAVVVLTDGLMNCNGEHPVPCACSQESGCGGGITYGATYEGTQPEFCLDDAPTLAEVQALAAAGVPTFFVVVGDGGDPFAQGVLSPLAAAGEGAAGALASASSPFVADPAALEARLADIVASVVAP